MRRIRGKATLSEQDVNMLAWRCAEVMKAALNRRRKCDMGERGGAQRRTGTGTTMTEQEDTTVMADRIVESMACASGHAKARYVTSEQLQEWSGAVSDVAMREWMHAD